MFGIAAGIQHCLPLPRPRPPLSPSAPSNPHRWSVWHWQPNASDLLWHEPTSHYRGGGVIQEREAREGEIKPAKQTVSTTTSRSRVPYGLLTYRPPDVPPFLPVPFLPPSPLPAPFLASVPGAAHRVMLRVPAVRPDGRQAPRSSCPAQGHAQSAPKH
eukprot:3152880-Rhodomonas_salina.1